MATGFLTRTISKIRLFSDEPSTNAKYTDSHLIDLIESSWADVLEEVMRGTREQPRVRHTVSVENKSSWQGNCYILPPTIRSILRVVKRSSGTGNIEWDIVPGSFHSPYGPGFTIEGNMIVFQPSWGMGAYDMELIYTPSGDIRLHEGTAGTISNDTDTNKCTVVLAETPDTGELDTRPNAYAGCFLRVLSASTNNYVQERVVSAYDVTSRTATLVPAFDSDLLPGGDTVTYEIAPLFGEGFDVVVAMDVASVILGIEGDANRAKLAKLEYARKMRTLRLNAANKNQVIGPRMEHDAKASGLWAWW